jgi:hypothetical protein
MEEFYEGNEFTDRIRCRSREKEESIDLVERVLKYSIIYSDEGTDYLAEESKYIEDPFLKLALELVIEKTDPNEVQSILSRHIISGDYHGKDFLQKMIILEGISAIQYKYSPYIVIEILLSLFGEDYIVDNKEDNYSQNLVDFILKFTKYTLSLKKAKLPDIENISMNPKEFRKLLKCDTKSIQKIAREVDNIFIVRAIKNLELGFKRVFYESIGERAAKILFKKEIELDFTPEEELEARSRILFILNKLIQSGEVVIEGSDYGLFL